MNRELVRVLEPLAARLGLETLFEVGVFFEQDLVRENYRIPDLSVFDRKHLSERGVERHAELVIEILSPQDESRQKLPFFVRCGIPEVWLVHPKTRAVEVYVLRDGAYALQPVGADGAVEAPRLGLTLRVTDEPKLVIEWDGGSASV